MHGAIVVKLRRLCSNILYSQLIKVKVTTSSKVAGETERKQRIFKLHATVMILGLVNKQWNILKNSLNIPHVREEVCKKP